MVLGGAAASAEEWFDAYESGLEALSKGQGTRAVELLERSIRMRSEPGENLLTYGTNRIEKYHPYLRLAEAHLMAGNPEAASRALQASLQKGKEPADQRTRLMAAVEAAQLKARAAAATPAPSPVAVATPTPPPPTLAPTPVATTAAAVASPTPAPATGTLILVSNPSGASVWVDGALVGETPLRLEKPPGEYRITLRHAGHAEQSWRARVARAQTTQETRTLTALATHPPPSTTAATDPASLVVLSDPPGASVYIDDEPVGTTDPLSGRLVKSGITPGTHAVRASLVGRQDVIQTAQVGHSGPTTARLELPLPTKRWVSPGRLAGMAVAVLVLMGIAVVLVARRRRQDEQPTAALPAVAGARTPTPRRPTPGRPTPGRPTPGRQAVPGASSSADLETRGLGAAAQANESFGDYLLVEALGKGGMAQVFLAERNGELFALKRPLASFLAEPEFLQRFLREAEIGRSLHHPNIIRIFERGEVDGVPYFTMEVVKGRTLQAVLRAEHSLPPRTAADVVAQVAEALDYAHLKGIVHRDLKPSNIMVLADGVVKVMDYGIARAQRFEGLTLTGSFLGTPEYVAPEIAEGRRADARSDLYSIGVVLYEMLTGQKPFLGETPFAILRKHCSQAPTPPSQVVASIPPELEAIVLKLLAKAPEQRYAQAEDLLNDLRAFINRAA